MNQPNPTAESIASPEVEVNAPAVAPSATPLANALPAGQVETVLHGGAWVPQAFGDFSGEIDALLHTAGVSDLGWRGKIRVTGTDRIRWMNGMVSNTIQALPEGLGNYSFLLSVQGRIQGDAWVYRRADELLLDTGKDQMRAVMQHLDQYIIMDDVELADVSQQWTAVSLAGPTATQVLTTLGVSLPAATLEHARMSQVSIGEVPCMLIELPARAVPRFELWFASEAVLSVWETLQAAGAHPCGLSAWKALRVLEATPQYGVDLNDRDLPQETAQAQALNFSKGCYLGQEIVERIRSRGKVNRQFKQFSLQGPAPATLPAELLHAGQSVGRITTTASLPGVGTLALGFIRLEVVERHAELTYGGGVATPLTAPPLIPARRFPPADYELPK